MLVIGPRGLNDAQGGYSRRKAISVEPSLYLPRSQFKKLGRKIISGDINVGVN